LLDSLLQEIGQLQLEGSVWWGEYGSSGAGRNVLHRPGHRVPDDARDPETRRFLAETSAGERRLHTSR